MGRRGGGDDGGAGVLHPILVFEQYQLHLLLLHIALFERSDRRQLVFWRHLDVHLLTPLGSAGPRDGREVDAGGADAGGADGDLAAHGDPAGKNSALDCFPRELKWT